MASKIFISYRRDDDPSSASRLRDHLRKHFDVFMDVSNIIPGQRFEGELGKALSECDVLIAVIGPRWLELLKSKIASGQQDFVREEIASALGRKIVVIPVRIGHTGSMAPLPQTSDLPDDIRELVAYHNHDVAYGHFDRDIAELCEAISKLAPTKRDRPPTATSAWAQIAWIAIAAGATFFLVRLLLRS